MSEVKSEEKKAPEVVGFSEAFAGRTFLSVNHDIEVISSNFANHIGEDKRFRLTTRKHAVFILGIIAGVNETLWKAYGFGPAENVLERPDNFTKYTALMLRLKALYEKYLTEKRIKAWNIVEDLEYIVIELIDFSREIMEQSKCEQLQNR